MLKSFLIYVVRLFFADYELNYFMMATYILKQKYTTSATIQMIVLTSTLISL